MKPAIPRRMLAAFVAVLLFWGVASAVNSYHVATALTKAEDKALIQARSLVLEVESLKDRVRKLEISQQ